MGARMDRIEKKNLRSPEASIIGSSLCSFGKSFNSFGLKTENPASNLGESSPTVFHKVSELMRGYIKLTISEKDAKIMKLMTKRRESEIMDRKLALAAHRTWEGDKLAEEKRCNEKKKVQSEYLKKKREMERFLYSIKQTEMRENSNIEAIKLENKIAEEHEMAERRKNLLAEQKLENRKTYFDSKRRVQRLMKQERAELEEMEKVRNLELFKRKEKRYQEKLSGILWEKKRRTVEESQKRKIKLEAAKIFRQESNLRMFSQNIEMLKIIQEKEEIRTEKVKFLKEWQKKMTKEKNLAKKRQHDFLLTKIFEEEAERIHLTKKKIEEKETKMKSFKEELEAKVAKGKIYAKATANLRDKIRTSYDL